MEKGCEPNCSNKRNRTLDSTRHEYVLLSCISELGVVFIEHVQPLASFCLKSFSRSSDVFKSPICFQRPRGCKLISSEGERASVFSILYSIICHSSIALRSPTEFPIRLRCCQKVIYFHIN